MFPRVRSHHVAPLQETDALQGKQQTKQELFRWSPTEPHTSFAHGIFLWFGKTLVRSNSEIKDRINQIREAHQCRIVYDNGLPGYRILCTMGDGCSERVQRVIGALKVVHSESLSDSGPGLRAYSVYPPPKILGAHVVKITRLGSSKQPLEAAVAMPGTKMTAQLVPVTTGEETAKSSTDDKMQLLKRTTPQYLALAVSSTLEKLRYRRARVRIRALLGVFIFDRYQKSFSSSVVHADDCEPALDFIQLMRSAKTQGGLYRLKPEARLLERVYQCRELFEIFEDREINDINPYHVGVWTFPSTNKADSAEVQLRVVTGLNEGPETPLRAEKSEWNASNENQDIQALELYVTNLLPELAWKLEIATQRCDRTISRELQTFSQGLQILPPTSNKAHVDNGELMFDWSGASVRPKRFHQKTSWRYRLRKNPNFIFEVSRVDEFNSTGIFRQTGNTNHVPYPKAREPCCTEWEACVFDSQWDEHLGQNLTLKTGECAGWDPSIETFFPFQAEQVDDTKHTNHISGFEAFMHTVQDVAGRLSRVTV